jgi:hypothetical protein
MPDLHLALEVINDHHPDVMWADLHVDEEDADLDIYREGDNNRFLTTREGEASESTHGKQRGGPKCIPSCLVASCVNGRKQD